MYDISQVLILKGVNQSTGSYNNSYLSCRAPLANVSINNKEKEFEWFSELSHMRTGVSGMKGAWYENRRQRENIDS